VDQSGENEWRRIDGVVRTRLPTRLSLEDAAGGQSAMSALDIETRDIDLVVVTGAR